MISRVIAYSIMILMLAAHFSRAGQNLLALIILLVPFLLIIRKRWVIQVLQGVAYLAALSWLYSAYNYIQTRIAFGDDWLRLLLILGAVALYSAWSGYFLRSPAVDARYGFELEAQTDQNTDSSGQDL